MLQIRLTLYLDISLIQIEKYMLEKDETHYIEVTTFTMPKIFLPIVMSSSMRLSFAVSLKMSLWLFLVGKTSGKRVHHIKSST